MKPFLAVTASLLLLLSCKKEETDALPPATQTGANTIGCLVNGKAWVPNGGGGYSGIKPVKGAYCCFGSTDTLRWHMWVRATNENDSGVHIWLRSVDKKGEYPLSFDTGTQPSVIFPKNYGYYYDSKGSYVTTSQYTGKVIITKADTMSGTISGTFEFSGYNSKTNQTVQITQGRFDVNYTKQ